MKLLALAAAGGAIGAGSRYLVNAAFGRWLGVATAFPWPTFAVNVLGSFLMGLLIAAFALKVSGSPELRTVLATGVLGGFTTFSAFSADVVALFERGDHTSAAIYVVASVACAVIAIFAGLAVGRMIWAA